MGVLELASLALEDLYELAPDDLALGLRLAHTRQMTQELVGGIHTDHLGMQLADKHVHHHVALVQAQQAVVDKNAGELVADGAVDQRRGDRRINATGQAKDDLFVADLFADLLHSLGDVITHHPVGAGAADLEHKALQNRCAALGVRHLRVELHSVKAPLLICHAGNRATVGARHQMETRRHFGDLVAVAHPDLQHAVAHWRGVVLYAVEQLRMAMRPHIGMAEFALVAGSDDAAELHRHREHAVADAQHRNTEFEHQLGRAQLVFLIGTGMAARQNDALESAIARIVAQPVVADIARYDLTKNMGLAHTPRNELGDLGAEIEDQDFLVVHLVFRYVRHRSY